MTTEHRFNGWWITETPPGVDEMGPYATRKEAESDRVGVERFLRIADRRAAFTTDTLTQR
jgi:hypothetical protein